MPSRYILFQVLILMLIVAIPLHFYVASELENNRYKMEQELQGYAQRVAHKIYLFSNSNEQEFYFPRSNIFKSGIYNEEGKHIFSLFEKGVDLSFTHFGKQEGYYYLKFRLKPNVFDAPILVVGKKISHARLFVNVLVILMVISLLVLFAILSIIRHSAEPYKQFNRYLENFIKDAMHEMKTPMGVILINLDGLSDSYQDNTMIMRARSALKNMMVVYEDLEFFVRKSRSEHPKEQLNISQYVQERVVFFDDLLRAKGIAVDQQIEHELTIVFSRLELSRIIDNTLSNAIKYSPSGTMITVGVRKEGEEILLIISDQGRGVKDTEKIFERYYRGEKISGGFGIGLSIVKAICDKNDVEIEVKSTLREGSEFVYHFQKSDR